MATIRRLMRLRNTDGGMNALGVGNRRATGPGATSA